jgi:hypothetical protein
MANKSGNGGPTVRTLTEGYVVKGGHNPGTSQIQTRPAAPAPITGPSTPSPSAPATNSSGGNKND